MCIRDSFEALSNPRFGSEKFDEIGDKDHILIVREKVEREAILKEVCKRLCESGYVKKEFYDDVITREKIESTAIGNEVAIPHGMPENVIKPKVFVVKLEYPVNWGGKMVSTIFLLSLIHIFFIHKYSTFPVRRISVFTYQNKFIFVK